MSLRIEMKILSSKKYNPVKALSAGMSWVLDCWPGTLEMIAAGYAAVVVVMVYPVACTPSHCPRVRHSPLFHHRPSWQRREHHVAATCWQHAAIKVCNTLSL